MGLQADSSPDKSQMSTVHGNGKQLNIFKVYSVQVAPLCCFGDKFVLT